jgi:hypothetical protein
MFSPLESSGDRSAWEGETIFHSDWWLNAVAPGQWRRLTVSRGGRLAGMLPLWESSKFGIKRWVMPPFTHVFGPALDTGCGTANARMHRRFSITRDLLEQIPRAALFDKRSITLYRTSLRSWPWGIAHFRIIQYL